MGEEDWSMAPKVAVAPELATYSFLAIKWKQNLSH